jgi:hypothetical protein
MLPNHEMPCRGSDHVALGSLPPSPCFWTQFVVSTRLALVMGISPFMATVEPGRKLALPLGLQF